MYPNYFVKNINSFKDLIEIMQNDHGPDVAFEGVCGVINYSELVDRILRFCTSISKVEYDKVVLDLKDALSFSIAYMACVLVGKIAILRKSSFLENEKLAIVNDQNYLAFMGEDPIIISNLPNLDINSVCTILHSSGTLSSPKGIMLSQKNIFFYSRPSRLH